MWARPNRIPVTTAATQTPISRPATLILHRRSAPKKNPRKKNSSAIGAITHTNAAVPISASVLRSTPKSLGSLSLPCRLNSAAQIAVAV